MNIEIISNANPKVREKNYINNFEVPFEQPIDCQNVKRTLVVTEVNYPLTTKNVNKDNYWFTLEMTIKDVKKVTHIDGLKYMVDKAHGTGTKALTPLPVSGEITITLDKIILLPGSYDDDQYKFRAIWMCCYIK